MSKRKKGNIDTEKQTAKPDSSQPQRINDNETQHTDHSHKENHVKGDEAKLTYRNISKLSNSKNFQHHPDNVKGHKKMSQEIKKAFKEAKNVPDNHLKNPHTGKIGELALKQNAYAQRGATPVEIYDSKVGGARDNGIDTVIKKAAQNSVIESKATRTEATFKLSKTKTQGEQMSPQWIRAKIREMWPSPKTAPTAVLLSNEPFNKFISGADVDYGTQTVRLITDPNRYKPLPPDVSIWNAANAASHTEMYAMRAINTVGKAASYIAITLDAAQVAGQIHHDIKKKDWSFSRSFRLVIEKGAGVVGSITAVVALNAGTDFVGCAGSFVVGAAGYDIGQDLGSDFADTIGLSPLEDDEREKATREGMNLIAGHTGVNFVDGVKTVAGTISDGLSSGRELLTDTLTANTSIKEAVNASYPSDSVQRTSEPEKAAPEKPLGFHARRLEIMKSHAENRSTLENSQASYPKCEAPVSSKNQSVMKNSEEGFTYQSPRPSPF